ncbi:MAG: terminase small subunit [Clostridia bacterium]|nr:terminase small subunit [Clostridia bacterium]
MKNGLKPKEKLFCIYYCQYRSGISAAALAGYPFAKSASAKLLTRKDIRNEIERLDEICAINPQEISSGYHLLALGDCTDVFRLLFCDEAPDETELEKMNLLNISEIKRPKNGGIEIKFFDRLKALEKLSELSARSDGDKALPFYDVIEKSAAAIRDDEYGT